MVGSVIVVVGTQWGDEGKGKLVDFLSSDADICMRFQGGGNAGHTVLNDFGEFKLHLVPCGIFRPKCICVLGTGTVVDPAAFLEELQALEQRGISTHNMFLSDRAHVVMPYHKLLDQVEDSARGAYRVDTTGRGIGPAYTDKVARIGIRVSDLLDETILRDKLSVVLRRHNVVLTTIYNQPPLELDLLMSQAQEWRRQLRPRVIDTMPLVRNALHESKNVILEGQLSAMKDIDWGSYPFVTSSSPTSGGAAVGSGIPPRSIDRVIGVSKAYSTQVGAGPMPTELRGAEAEHLRNLGGEFGATTGRARRVGWFDAVVSRFVSELNGCTELAITKLDILDNLAEIPVCIAYRYKGELLTDLPDPAIHEQCEPVYEILPGWLRPTVEMRTLQDLPRDARVYLDRLTELVNVPLHSVGVGPHRDQTILA